MISTFLSSNHLGVKALTTLEEGFQECKSLGPLNAPKHMGTLILNGGGLRIINVNTDYSIADATEVTLEKQIFKFNNTAFSDTQFGTQGAIKGEINHLNFRDWGLVIHRF